MPKIPAVTWGLLSTAALVAACGSEASNKSEPSSSEVLAGEPDADFEPQADADAGAEEDEDEDAKVEEDDAAPAAADADGAALDPTLLDAAIEAQALDAAIEAEALDAGSVNGALPDATEDAMSEDEIEASLALPPDVSRLCPPAAMCSHDGYPCLASDDGTGYQCRGLYAAWPMPEKVVDAKAAPSYTVYAEDDVVLDNVTGLLWQRTTPALYPGCTGQLSSTAAIASGCTWDDANRYCGELSLAGKSWRLPTKIELESLLDFVSSPVTQLLDPKAFPNADVKGHWSASESAVRGPDHAYVVSLLVGIARDLEKKVPGRVRCVHSQHVVSAAPDARYQIDEAADTVADRFTKLEWQRHASEQALSVDEAADYCRSTGFRVPSFKELMTTFDPTAEPFSVDSTAFPELPLGWWLWSKTSIPSGGTLVFSPFGGGELTDIAIVNEPFFAEEGPYMASFHVRCVR